MDPINAVNQRGRAGAPLTDKEALSRWRCFLLHGDSDKQGWCFSLPGTINTTAAFTAVTALSLGIDYLDPKKVGGNKRTQKLPYLQNILLTPICH